MISITELRSTIRLYGQSSHSKRITGTFTIQLGNGATSCVKIVEGHVNRNGRAQRLISFVDCTTDAMLSDFFKSVKSQRIEIVNDTHKVQFLVERVSIEVVGVSDEKVTGLRYRGEAKSQLNPDDVFTLFEVDSSGNRQFHIEAPQEAVARAMQHIRYGGRYNLILRTTDHH